MTYRDRSVSMGLRNNKTFKSVLGDVKVSEIAIKREKLKGKDDWDKIASMAGEEEILAGKVFFREINSIEKKCDFLSYPHILLKLEKGEKTKKLRIFFKEDSQKGYDRIKKCFNLIEKRWAAFKERNKPVTRDYSYKE